VNDSGDTTHIPADAEIAAEKLTHYLLGPEPLEALLRAVEG
jgi:hypothetical protein